MDAATPETAAAATVAAPAAVAPLSYTRVSLELGVSVRHVGNLVLAGKLTPLRDGRRVFFAADEVARLRAERERQRAY